MAPMHSTDMFSSDGHSSDRHSSDRQAPYSPRQQQQLLTLARESIDFGASHNRAIDVDLQCYDRLLQQQGCSFVTLHKTGKLRGCIGALSPYQPLVKDIAVHAYAAAFEDPRFPGVSRQEIEQLRIDISVLTPQVELNFDDEDDLLAQLVPFEDGLSLEDRHYRSTFLPAVWDSINDKRDFLTQLKLKAGMTSEHWSSSLKAYRYHTICIKEQDTH